MLGLFLNTLAAGEKYPLLKRENLTVPIQMQLSQKQKKVSQFFTAFFKSTINLKYFEKKMTLIDFVFPKLRSPKSWSDKCLKSSVSKYPSTSNMINVLMHCWNLHQCTFLLFIDHWKVNWVGKRLCYWHAKSWDCLWTHLPRTKCILFLVETV